MEADGEGGGGQAGRRGRIELRRLLEAIESSEALEKRIPIIKQLEGSSQFSADDLGLIIEGLLASWTDSTCSGVSHCTLHKSILQVALKCTDMDLTDYLRQFLTLGAKASSWCRKHLQWPIKSTDEAQVVQEEEHDKLFLEINSMCFILSTNLLGIAAKCFTVLGLEVAVGERVQGTTHEELELVPAHLAVGATPCSLAPVLSPPTQKASRRCTHCASEKTPRWLRGPDGSSTLCSACGQRFYKGRLLHSNFRRYQFHPSKNSRPSKENGNDMAVPVEVPSENNHDMAMASGSHTALPQEAMRQCTHCESKKTPRWLWGPNGPNTLCNACGLRFYKGRLLNSYSSRRRSNPSKQHPQSKESGNAELVEGQPENDRAMSMEPRNLAPLPQEMSRRCTHCASEKSARWLRGPNGPGTLCNGCGQRFMKGRLLQPSNPRSCRGRRSSNSAAGNNVAALVKALPCGVDASMDAFFDQTGSEVAWEEAGPEQAEEEEELEWLSNKDAFPSVETMALEVEQVLDALPAAARTKGRRRVRRVTARETCRQENVPPAEKETVVSPVLPRRRCTHCTTEETTAWRVGPEGPYTLCNPCGLVFVNKGRLLPEYRPANSPAFSPQLHSNKYSRALEMHRRNETSATGEMQVEFMDPPANGPASSPLQRYSFLGPALDERCQSEEETSAARRVTSADAWQVQLLPEAQAPTGGQPLLLRGVPRLRAHA